MNSLEFKARFEIISMIMLFLSWSIDYFFILLKLLESAIPIIIKEELLMKINKLCYGQKARLILGTHPEHTYGIN